jgi:hypothetical protein
MKIGSECHVIALIWSGEVRESGAETATPRFGLSQVREQSPEATPAQPESGTAPSRAYRPSQECAPRSKTSAESHGDAQRQPSTHGNRQSGSLAH